MIVNLIELNLLLFIYLFNIFYSFSLVSVVSYLRIYNIVYKPLLALTS